MEVVDLLLASKHGIAALATVTLAIAILASFLGGLAYKATRPVRSSR